MQYILGTPDQEHAVDVPDSLHHQVINRHDIDGLVEVRRKSSALAMELRLSCTNPLTSKYVSWAGCLFSVCISIISIESIKKHDLKWDHTA